MTPTTCWNRVCSAVGKTHQAVCNWWICRSRWTQGWSMICRSATSPAARRARRTGCSRGRRRGSGFRCRKSRMRRQSWAVWRCRRCCAARRPNAAGSLAAVRAAWSTCEQASRAFYRVRRSRDRVALAGGTPIGDVVRPATISLASPKCSRMIGQAGNAHAGQSCVCRLLSELPALVRINGATRCVLIMTRASSRSSNIEQSSHRLTRDSANSPAFAAIKRAKEMTIVARFSWTSCARRCCIVLCTQVGWLWRASRLRKLSCRIRPRATFRWPTSTSSRPPSNKTQLGQLANDPAMKPFVDDLKRQLQRTVDQDPREAGHQLGRSGRRAVRRSGHGRCCCPARPRTPRWCWPT